MTKVITGQLVSTTRILSKFKPVNNYKCGDKFKSILFLPDNETRIDEGGLRKNNFYKKINQEMPLLTIVIAVYNGGLHLEEVILSVVNQTYNNVELIIIDGGSSDDSLKIIKKYNDVVDYWVSEKDLGISDAFNKAVRLATGEYINFQGDGDGFYSDNSLERIMANINSAEDMFVSARIQRISKEGDELYESPYIPNFDKKSLLFRMSLPHQGLFTHIDYFKNYGMFDVNNTYCMDYEHLLRSYHNFPSVITRNVVVAKWRADGLGNGRDLEIFKEYHKIKVDNKIAGIAVLKALNLWILFKYYLKKIIR